MKNIKNKTKWAKIAKQFLIERKELLELLHEKKFSEAKEILKDKTTLSETDMLDFNFGCAAYTLIKNEDDTFYFGDNFELWDDVIDVGDMIPQIKLKEIEELAS